MTCVRPRSVGAGLRKGPQTLVSCVDGDVCCGGFFFFQAEDGIRDLTVTGVQTCALPILRLHEGSGEDSRVTDRKRWGEHQRDWEKERLGPALEKSPERHDRFITQSGVEKIGRASCRERV